MIQGIPQRYTQYAEDGVSGKIVACEAICLACQRYLDWFSRTDIFFDVAKIQKIERFLPLLKHFEGEFNGVPFQPLDWQLWCICNIFGWYRVDDPTKRVIRNVFMLISRKNGKTALSAALMLANMVCDAEAGYEGYLVANNREQAKVAFKFVAGFSRSIDPKHKHIKVYRDYITYDKTHAKIKVLSADAMGNDGYNPATFIWDEVAAAKDYSNYNILKSGQAMRKNPLSISISSAGFLLDTYPCYEMCKVGKRVLRGEATDDSTFYAIYQLDDGDDYTDEKNWKKACPSYPIIAQRDYMIERINEAELNTAKATDVKTKNFNIWCQSAQSWLPMSLVEKCNGKIDLDKLKDEPCYIGIDLSETRDLTALSVCFPPNPYREYKPDKYLFKIWAWIPRAAMEQSDNSHLYKWFVQQGWAEVTAGNSVDYDYILSFMMKLVENHTVVQVCYDQWQAAMLTQKAIAEGIPMLPFSQGLGSFNRPTKTMEVLICRELCEIELNPMINWMFNNCELKLDHMNNAKPIKSGDNQLNKIDGIIAMLEALGGVLLEQLSDSLEVVDLKM